MSRFRDLTFELANDFCLSTLSCLDELLVYTVDCCPFLLLFLFSLVCVDNVKKVAAELVIGIADEKNLFVHALGGKFHLNLTRYWRHRRISLENLTRGVSKLYDIQLKLKKLLIVNKQFCDFLSPC